MKWNYKIFSPKFRNNFEDELASCMTQLGSFINENHHYKIIRLNVYIEGLNTSEYIQKRDLIHQSLKNIQKSEFIFEIIPQKPVGQQLVMKAMYFDSVEYPYEYKYTETKKCKTLLLVAEKSKILLTSVSSFSRGITDDSEICFQSLQHSLKSNQIGFKNVARQWNYIGEILNATTSQNYQVFNDIRSKYYNIEDFNYGYPAATGIGMDLPGIIIQSIAYDYSSGQDILPINNPNQIPAHKYSKNVLVGDINGSNKTTPKFERGKIILSEGQKWIYVSGTAAIKGENHVLINDAGGQALETLKLIMSLVSNVNLEANGIRVVYNNLKPATYRAYVKHEKDVEIVAAICDDFFGDAPGVVLIADICRDPLLVEIECEFEIIS